MKRLFDLIADQARRSVVEGYRADDLVAVSGTIGAVQEWLTQPEVVAEAEVNGWPASTEGARRMLEGLRKQAGEGLE